jgi:hypothetical protein
MRVTVLICGTEIDARMKGEKPTGNWGAGRGFDFFGNLKPTPFKKGVLIDRGRQRIPWRGVMPKHKILVIDDEKPTLSMFLLFLKAYGYEVLLAENGAQGLKIFEAESPAIVFTDLKMPGMDGFEVLDRIKSQSPETEVIVITGHGDMDLAD